MCGGSSGGVGRAQAIVKGRKLLCEKSSDCDNFYNVE
jgi:hypothetical protein